MIMTYEQKDSKNAYMREWYLKNKERIKAKKSELARIWQKNNPDRHRASKLRDYYKHRDKRCTHNWAMSLKRLYGISAQDYEIMLNEQGRVCAICKSADPGSNKKRFCVDHNHKTGEARALLCDKCNRWISRFESNREWLDKAVEYLKKYGW